MILLIATKSNQISQRQYIKHFVGKGNKPQRQPCDQWSKPPKTISMEISNKTRLHDIFIKLYGQDSCIILSENIYEPIVTS